MDKTPFHDTLTAAFESVMRYVDASNLDIPPEFREVTEMMAWAEAMRYVAEWIDGAVDHEEGTKDVIPRIMRSLARKDEALSKRSVTPPPSNA